MKFKIGDKVVYRYDRTNVYTVIDRQVENQMSGSFPIYRISKDDIAVWYDENTLEKYDEQIFNDTINKYNLKFADVLNEIFDNDGWYQGINFNKNEFIAVAHGVIVKENLTTKKKFRNIEELIINSNIVKMPYRKIN